MNFTTDRETSERLVERYGVPEGVPVRQWWNSHVFDFRSWVLQGFENNGRFCKSVPAFELPHLLALAGLDEPWEKPNEFVVKWGLRSGLTVASLAALLLEE